MTAHPTSGSDEAKVPLRRALLAARRAVPGARREADAAALSAAAVAVAAGTGGPVCAYLPIGTEPGSIGGLDALRAAGHDVLLPVVPTQPGPLDWARYTGPDSLADGPWGLREPTGPRIGVAGLTRAALVLVPALAVDRQGVRLGRGGGFYDRTLPLAAAGTLVAAVVGDDELVEALPAGPFDVRVAAVLRPATGLTRLPVPHPEQGR